MQKLEKAYRWKPSDQSRSIWQRQFSDHSVLFQNKLVRYWTAAIHACGSNSKALWTKLQMLLQVALSWPLMILRVILRQRSRKFAPRLRSWTTTFRSISSDCWWEAVLVRSGANLGSSRVPVMYSPLSFAAKNSGNCAWLHYSDKNLSLICSAWLMETTASLFDSVMHHRSNCRGRIKMP